MTEPMENDRVYAALLARRYFHEQSVEKKLLVGSFSRTTDPLIAELLDLLADEPRRPRSADDFTTTYLKKYMPEVDALLEQLDKGPLGRLPEPGRFAAKPTLRRAVLCSLIVIFTVMGAVTRGSLDIWSVMTLVFAPIVVVFELIGLRDSIARYIRSRERREVAATGADCLSEGQSGSSTVAIAVLAEPDQLDERTVVHDHGCTDALRR